MRGGSVTSLCKILDPAELETKLPVRHETWRYGSPHTLVLTKSEELFRREDAERQQALADLARLRDGVGNGGH